VVDTLFGALEVVAASQGTMNNFTWGNSSHQYYETLCGGVGAGPDFPGADAVQSHMTNSRLTDPEILEARFPVRVEAFGIRSESGGSGVQPGGNGAYRRLRFNEAMVVGLLAGSRRIAPPGLAGGGCAAVGRQWLIRADSRSEALAGIDSRAVEPGDTLIIETPGGGAYGDV